MHAEVKSTISNLTRIVVVHLLEEARYNRLVRYLDIFSDIVLLDNEPS